MFFRAVYDHNTGHLLKIGSKNLIMRGYHGFTPLKKQEIISTYGKNPLIPDYHALKKETENFTNLHEMYGASIVPLIA